MRRRVFVQLAALGAAAHWLPGCASTTDESAARSGAHRSDVPATAPELTVAPPAPNAGMLVVGVDARAFSIDGRSVEIASLHHRVDVMGSDGRRRATLGGSRPTAEVGAINGPVAAVWDDARERILVLEYGNDRVQSFDPDGASPSVLTSTNGPADLALHPTSGALFVAASRAHTIEVYSESGRPLGSIGSFGLDAAGLNGPCSVATAKDDAVHVVDLGSRLVKVFSSAGRYLRSYGNDEAGRPLVGPRSIRFDDAGRAWVADTFGAAIHVFDEAGRWLARFEPTLHGRPAAPRSLALRADGTMYAALIPAA